MSTTAVSRRMAAVLAGVAALVLASCGGAADPDDDGPSGSSPPTTVTTSTPADPPSPTLEELSWEEVMEASRGALARISVGTCTGPTMGSGFFIDERHVVTAAHVVEDATELSIQTESQAALAATVLDLDIGHDVALLRTEPQSGLAPLRLREQEARQASELAVIGFPLGVHSPQISDGIVSGSSEPVEYADRVVESVFTTNASTNGGNSGGPVVDRFGEVIGLVSGGVEWVGAPDALRPVEGVNYIVPATTIAPFVTEWAFQPTPIPAECAGDVFDDDADLEPEDQDPLPVDVLSDHELAGVFALILHTHGSAINTGQYGTAWSYFTAEQQEKLGGLDAWSMDVGPSFWRHIEVRSVAESSAAATVGVVLRTEDLLESGALCTVFTLDYEFVQSESSWLINRARSTADPLPCPGGD